MSQNFWGIFQGKCGRCAPKARKNGLPAFDAKVRSEIVPRMSMVSEKLSIGAALGHTSVVGSESVRPCSPVHLG